MQDVHRRIGDAFERIDLVLAAAGVISLLLLLLVVPGLLFQRAAKQHIPRHDAIVAAQIFAERASGVDLTDADPEASIFKNSDLLDSLQSRHGRTNALDLIERDSIHAFYWRVAWEIARGSETDDLGEVRLALDGRPIGLALTSNAVSARGHDAGALNSLTAGERPGLADSTALVTDSVFLSRLVFRLDGEVRESPLHEMAAGSQRIFLDKSDVGTLAKYHLRQSALSAVRDEPDSIRATSQEGRETASAYFSSADTALGRRFTAALELLPTGSLVKLETRWVREEEDDDEITAESIADFLQPTIYVILSLLILVIFFRRLNARLIDTRMSLRDGLIFGLAAGIATLGAMADQMGTSAIEIAVMALTLVITSGAAAALIFFLSGAVNSIARDVWHQKLQTLDLLRNGVIRNVPVGRALVRGTLAGLVFVGILGLALMLFPDVRLDFSDGETFYLTEYPGLPFVMSVAGLSFLAFMVTMTALVGVGTLIRRKTESAILVIGGVTVLLCMLQISPLELEPLGAEYILSTLLGLAMAWVLWRFDLITTFIALFFFMLLWTHVEGLVLPTSPEGLSAILSISLAVVVGVLGFVGAMSGKTSTEVPVIVPEYIQELAQRERLNREFELAREVQLSFLPVRTPDFRGLDIASICLPAAEVGGDYYDFFNMPGGRLGVVVGDVSGKGMRAAFYMTLMKGILQSVVQRDANPTDILSRANQIFRMNAPRGTFMSMIFGVLDPETKTCIFARAGHNPLLIKRTSVDQPEIVKPNGAALGLAPDDVFVRNIENVSVPLSDGDVLVIFTDGVTEAMNPARELYDDERLLDLVGRCGTLPAGLILDSIVQNVEEFQGTAPRHDDMTIVIIRVDGL